MQKFTISGRLDGLNEYISAINSSRHKGNKLKKDNQGIIAWFVRKLKPIKKPCKLIFRWYEPNARRDIDNVASGKKFILDCLVIKKILPNDNQKWVKGFSDEFFIDSKNPRIEVEIYEFESEELQCL